MKKLLFGLALATATLLCGCVSQSDYDALAADFHAMNERVSKIEDALAANSQTMNERVSKMESDLYKVEIKTAPRDNSPKVEEKSAPKQAKKTELKFVPSKEIEQSVVDTKINTFLMEYLGVAFGDNISKYPNALEEHIELYESHRMISVLKKFQYFDKALAHFEDGQLYAVSFFADIDKKYSIDSIDARIEQTKADLAVTLGLDSDAFERLPAMQARHAIRVAKGDSSAKAPPTSYGLYNCSPILAPDGFLRKGVRIVDVALKRRLTDRKTAKKRAKGEQLPESK